MPTLYDSLTPQSRQIVDKLGIKPLPAVGVPPETLDSPFKDLESLEEIETLMKKVPNSR